jgi:hypothetical protein
MAALSSRQSASCGLLTVDQEQVRQSERLDNCTTQVKVLRRLYQGMMIRIGINYAEMKSYRVLSKY